MGISNLALEAVVRQNDRVIARCLIRRGRYVIGQERKNEIVADCESISARHARLSVVSDEHLFIEDLGSANGTFVDGQAIREETPITVESDIVLGQVNLSFQRGGLPAAVFKYLPEGFLKTSRYALEKAMVEGHTSTIYEARDTVLHRRVALKVLHRDAQDNPAQVLSFVRENQIVAQLPHSCILPVYDFGLDGEIGLYSATRFVEGETLSGLLSGMATDDGKAPQATLQSLLLIFMKMCDAAAFAHARGVVHGTLQPAAIIFGRFGEVFVDRWGFATLQPPSEDGRVPVEAPESTVLPPISRYSAPEQMVAGGEITPRTDVYSLGVILFRILTLRHFNNGDTEEQVVAQALQSKSKPIEAFGAAPPPSHVPAGYFPEALCTICARALNRNPAERYPSAHELKAEVAHWLEHLVDAGSRSLSKKSAGLFGKR
jgi:serine/threonine protein kinase